MSYENAAITYFPFGVCAPLQYLSFLEEKRVPINIPFEAGMVLEDFFQDKSTELNGIQIIPYICFADACKKLQNDMVFQKQIMSLVFGRRAKFWFLAQEAALYDLQKLHQQYLPPECLYFHSPSPEDGVYTIGKSLKRSDGVLSIRQLTKERLTCYS